jgi:molybdate transport system permease protein
VIRRRLFEAGLALAALLAFAFLLLPLVAIFSRVPLGELFRQLGSNVAVDAVVVTAKANAIAQAAIVLVGTPAAYLLAGRRFRGRALAVTLVELPLVLPPAVAGIGLLAAFGRLGLLGGTFDALGISISFTQAAVVLAVAYVASPFYLRQAIAAFETLDQSLLDASRTLGAGPARTFARVALPLAGRGLAAGAALSFARGIGEFGATIMFAGSLQGVTQTLSLAIYAQFDVNFDIALALGALLVLVSGAILLTAKLLPLWTRSRSISVYPFAPSGSS